MLALTCALATNAFAQDSDAITAVEIPQPEVAAPPAQAESASKIHGAGVPYTLTGVISVEEDRVRLDLPDGRLFELQMPAKKAEKLDGKLVTLYGKAEQSDRLEVIKVKDIKPAAVPKPKPAKYKKGQKRSALLPSSGGDIRVTNVRWLYREKPVKNQFAFTTAIINPEKLEKIYFMKEPFAPEWIAAHSFFVFKFAPGGFMDTKGNSAEALVLTIEAYLKKGQEYSLADGAKNKFDIVWMLDEWEEYAPRKILEQNHHFVPYEVLLDPAQKRTILEDSIKFATQNRAGEYYNTITNNCTNNLVVLINRALPENKRIKMWRIPGILYNLRATMPSMTPKYLQKKGILGPALPHITADNYTQPLP